MSQDGGKGRLRHEFVLFATVGALGFGIDAALFLLLNGHYTWSIPAARLVSATCSIATTWALNRQLTFADRKSPQRGAELAQYTLVQAGGLAVNFGVFATSLLLFPPLRSVPIVALALGAAVALVFNFASARTLVFRGPATR
jgi:putative flippase GtrA